eukprot:m.26253 g.26253  ORF g.26253 m.26253 type:complete len:66 (+) comp15330_c0_seq1:14-211(+)
MRSKLAIGCVNSTAITCTSVLACVINWDTFLDIHIVCDLYKEEENEEQQEHEQNKKEQEEASPDS